MCGNVTLTLTPVEFLVLAEEIGAMRHQLKEEGRRGREESMQHETSFENWPTNCEASFITPSFWPRNSILIKEEVVRVEFLVLNVPITKAMKLVCSVLSNKLEIAPTRASC